MNDISITNIDEQSKTMKCKKKDFATTADGCQCMNSLKSYKLNGITGVVGTKIKYNGFEGYKTTIYP